MEFKNVCAVVLNWNNSPDTIKCIESLLSHYPFIKIIVVDNCSSDNSVKILDKFFSESIESYKKHSTENLCKTDGFYSCNLQFIVNKENYGYAGGNNTALKYLMHSNNVEYIWILNNDCITEKKSLPEMLVKIRNEKNCGFVGSLTLYEDKPKIIQCYGGGKIYPMLGISKLYLKGIPIDRIPKKISSLDYIMGSSMLIPMHMLNDVGLMRSDYFMYFEEVDWQYEAAKKGWKIAVADKSIVYHGDSKSTRNNRMYYYYYLNRSTILFLKRHHGILPAVSATFFLLLINNIRLLRNFTNLKYSIKGIMDGWYGRLSSE